MSHANFSDCSIVGKRGTLAATGTANAEDDFPDFSFLPLRESSLIPPAQLANIKENVLADLDAQPHRYHNRQHTEQVLKFAQEYALEAGLSPIESQLLEVGALFHDYQHSGNRYRQLNPNVTDSPELSNEEHAADLADDAVISWYTESHRMTLRFIILATSFGQMQIDKLPAEHARFLFRAYRPETKLEKLLAFADVSNYRGGIDSFVNDNLNVFRESSPSQADPTLLDTYTNCLAFLGYVQQKLNEVKEMFPDSFAQKLQDQLHEVQSNLRALSS